MKSYAGIVAVTLVALSASVGLVVAGLTAQNLSAEHRPIQSPGGMDWTPPLKSSIPNDAHGSSIRLGALIFNQTPVYAARFTGAKVSCSSCHAEAGTRPFASPLVGLPALFPMYTARAGRVISFKDRIQECFVRSENGRPLDYDGRPMKAIVDYINWLSQPEPGRRALEGRGLVTLPDLKPDASHGREIYHSQCAVCHGETGAGIPPLFPPVWGPNSFNDGAGMYQVRKMAAFVQHNMPQNRMGTLSAQDAFDVAAFIHAQPRPAFNLAYKHF